MYIYKSLFAIELNMVADRRSQSVPNDFIDIFLRVHWGSAKLLYRILLHSRNPKLNII